MEVREHGPGLGFNHVPHWLLRKQVRDIASGSEGVLMAVVYENVAVTHWVHLAYIRLPSGREISTAVDNIEAV
ncbi:hypothetical protein [Streptomyces sp. R33]|uniref:Uncharacterized protein n=1 Tax=Streptomyces sp. R33 TaxID=3238629 RepID=A0AB39Y8H0_9ACTN